MKRLRRIGIVMLLQFLLLELLSFGVGRALQNHRRMFVVPRPPEGGEPPTWASYVARRDPLLGWPSPAEFGGVRFDERGVRRLPGLEGLGPACVALYGDSFTFGDELPDEQAWGYHLARRLGCRVDNYGVGGYGSDQAYLRYREVRAPGARVVVLGHLSENVLRNLSRDRDLLNGTRFHALKPRFVLGPGGELELLPLPELDERGYRRSVGLERPWLAVEEEHFQPGGLSGAVELEFPFTLSVLQNLGYYRMAAWLRREPEHAAFYAPDHPLQGTELTRTICAEFAREVRERGQLPLVLLLPTRSDLRQRAAGGAWCYAPLAEALVRSEVEFLDFGPRLEAAIGGGEIDAWFMPRGHYGPRASELLAEFVGERAAALLARR